MAQMAETDLVEVARVDPLLLWDVLTVATMATTAATTNMAARPPNTAALAMFLLNARDNWRRVWLQILPFWTVNKKKPRWWILNRWRAYKGTVLQKIANYQNELREEQ